MSPSQDVCPECGRVFTIKKSSQKYCSPKCQVKHYSKDPKTKAVCALWRLRNFERKQTLWNQWSKENDRTKYHREYYQKKRATPGNKRKQAAISKAQYHRVKKERCEFCGALENLQNHHPDYEYPLITVTVCPSCHQWIHNNPILGGVKL